MKNHLLQINHNLQEIKKKISIDVDLRKDIDFNFDFISPYTKADNLSDIKLIIIGQDPTVRNISSRKGIKSTLNLEKNGSLRKFVNDICCELNLNIDKDIYATNLYKCFFTVPPADDETILYRHAKYWINLLKAEISVFDNPIIISLGEPLLRQLLRYQDKKVRYYWDYIGKTTSGKNFKFINENDNYLNKQIFPIAHQPSYCRNRFYKKYLPEYLKFILDAHIRSDLYLPHTKTTQDFFTNN